ncbi:MAG: ribonuclease P protein component [Clostridia bacterium]|nr:ribonuclease P protein component [Clostridia bacterium]
MTKLYTLKLNKDFKTAYYHGKTFVHPLLILYVRKNREKVSRIGITTGKKIGGAVQRNRCRRIIREAYRPFAARLQGHYDLVFVARKATVETTSTKLHAVIGDMLKKAGLPL